MAMIKCENISIAYEGQTVVHDLSFQVSEDDYLCIVGENGSGKSTLVKSILGLKNPVRGKIILGDGLSQNEIGYLLGIRELERQCFRDLSGGQKQRVLLARALCATRKLLLLDEPVTGLDPIVTQEFYQLIKQINRDSRMAVVMVSHDIESTMEYASHILHLQETALFFGTAEEYRNSEIGKAFLGGGQHVR